MKTKKSIVLLSGGLDSMVSLAEAKLRTKVVLALTFDYGQKASEQEIISSRKISSFYKIPNKVLDMHCLKKITNSALTDVRKPLPKVSEEMLDDTRIMKKTAKEVWVPERNAIFITIAAAFAEKLKCDYVVCGFNLEESRTFPDNSREFVDSMNSVLKYSALMSIKAVSYTQNLKKEEIAKLGMKLNVPFHYIYSCYAGKAKMCGMCESCQRAKRAFKKVNAYSLIKKKFIYQ